MKRIDEFDFVETHFGKIQTGSLVKARKTGLRIISTAPILLALFIRSQHHFSNIS